MCHLLSKSKKKTHITCQFSSALVHCTFPIVSNFLNQCKTCVIRYKFSNSTVCKNRRRRRRRKRCGALLVLHISHRMVMRIYQQNQSISNGPLFGSWCCSNSEKEKISTRLLLLHFFLVVSDHSIQVKRKLCKSMHLITCYRFSSNNNDDNDDGDDDNSGSIQCNEMKMVFLFTGSNICTYT